MRAWVDDNLKSGLTYKMRDTKDNSLCKLMEKPAPTLTSDGTAWLNELKSPKFVDYAASSLLTTWTTDKLLMGPVTKW